MLVTPNDSPDTSKQLLILRQAKLDLVDLIRVQGSDRLYRHATLADIDRIGEDGVTGGVNQSCSGAKRLPEIAHPFFQHDPMRRTEGLINTERDQWLVDKKIRYPERSASRLLARNDRKT